MNDAASVARVTDRALEDATSILGKCVHCGFCAATCPTYQLTGDELEGPRGRLYLIKAMLEGNPVSAQTQSHLDSCLTCLACETTCPSGVKYGHLVDVGRSVVDRRVGRSFGERLFRFGLLSIFPFRTRFARLLAAARAVRRVLPRRLERALPPVRAAAAWPDAPHARRVAIMQGCVQAALAPGINAAAARVLDRLGIRATTVDDRCCGALGHHTGAPAQARRMMKHNIDVWSAAIADGCEAIVVTASGCAAFVKEYAWLLREDAEYCASATRLMPYVKDVAEIVRHEDLSRLPEGGGMRVAFHSPCSLQHGEKLPGVVETILSNRGYGLTDVPEAHLCCGSAGSYSLRHPDVADQLRRRKLAALQSDDPAVIATANVGCLAHLSGEAALPVVHWIELLAEPCGLRQR